MAVLTAAGITFSDSTSLASRYGIIPQNSVVVFYQSGAPTGWTKVTTQDNKALRVVQGTGGVAGGTNTFSGTFISQPISGTVPVSITASVGNHTLTSGQIPAHTHPANVGPSYWSTPGPAPSPAFSGTLTPQQGNVTGNNTPADGAHAHPFAVNAASGPFSTTMDLRVQYIDVIICSFTN